MKSYMVFNAVLIFIAAHIVESQSLYAAMFITSNLWLIAALIVRKMEDLKK